MVSALCVYLLVLAVPFINAFKPCGIHGNGYCENIFHSTCPVGMHVTYRGCGFLELCCSPPNRHIESPISSTSVTCGVTEVNYNSRIIGGSSTVIDKYPWTVSLRYNGSHLCGGSIINKRWILTAAHCFNDLPYLGIIGELSVIAGSTYQDHYLSRANSHYNVERVITHAMFVLNEQADIALVKVSRDIDLHGRSKRSICLAHPGDDFSAQMCVVTGWGAVVGKISRGFQPPAQSRLREVTLPIVRRSVCEYYMGQIHDTMLCAGTLTGGMDACQGDTGGALACKGADGIWTQAGIVSYGVGCAQAYTFGVYTDVSKFQNWIQYQMSRYR